jgi:hypothetical protein
VHGISVVPSTTHCPWVLNGFGSTLLIFNDP